MGRHVCFGGGVGWQVRASGAGCSSNRCTRTCACKHMSACVSVRQRTSEYVSMLGGAGAACASNRCARAPAPVGICQHTAAYGSIRQHAWRRRGRMLQQQVRARLRLYGLIIARFRSLRRATCVRPAAAPVWEALLCCVCGLELLCVRS